MQTVDMLVSPARKAMFVRPIHQARPRLGLAWAML